MEAGRGRARPLEALLVTMQPAPVPPAPPAQSQEQSETQVEEIGRCHLVCGPGGTGTVSRAVASRITVGSYQISPRSEAGCVAYLPGAKYKMFLVVFGPRLPGCCLFNYC